MEYLMFFVILGLLHATSSNHFPPVLSNFKLLIFTIVGTFGTKMQELIEYFDTWNNSLETCYNLNMSVCKRLTLGYYSNSQQSCHKGPTSFLNNCKHAP